MYQCSNVGVPLRRKTERTAASFRRGDRSKEKADVMTNMNGREALRGAEEETFDLIAEICTSEQWANFLRAPLERAAAQGKLSLAQKLMGAGAKIGNALHDAVRGGHREVIHHLLNNGAMVSAKDTRGRTPLHLAAKCGKTEVVQQLLLKGADKDAKDAMQLTPLFIAACCGHLGVTLALFAAGADVNLSCGEIETPVLNMAAEYGHVNVLRACIEHGADMNATDERQQTALHLAAQNNKAEAIDVIVKAGANADATNVFGFTPLHTCARRRHLEAVVALVKNGANPNVQDRVGITPLHYVVSAAGTQEAAEVVDLLLRSGADETIVDACGGKAEGLVGDDHDENHRPIEDVSRVRKLLANAPADRVWRRRGYLVLCRAYPDRVQLRQEISNEHAGPTSETCSHASGTSTKANECTNETVGGSVVEDWGGGDWAGVAAIALGMKEEDVFRTVIGYL